MQRMKYNRVFWYSAIFALFLALSLIGSVEANQAAYEAGVNALSIGDRAAAAAHFRKAAEAGHPQGQYYLGLLVAADTTNSGNDVEALKWMRMSAEKGIQRLSKHWEPGILQVGVHLTIRLKPLFGFAEQPISMMLPQCSF